MYVYIGLAVGFGYAIPLLLHWKMRRFHYLWLLMTTYGVILAMAGSMYLALATTVTTGLDSEQVYKLSSTEGNHQLTVWPPSKMCGMQIVIAQVDGATLDISAVKEMKWRSRESDRFAVWFEQHWNTLRPNEFPIVEVLNAPLSGMILEYEVGEGRGTQKWEARVRPFESMLKETAVVTGALGVILSTGALLTLFVAGFHRGRGNVSATTDQSNRMPSLVEAPLASDRPHP